MSQLIHMRQRIKAVETIKKITGAMRLISRSVHTRLDKQKKPLAEYRAALCQLLDHIKTFCPEWTNSRFFPDTETPKKELFILIGAQKGLCGNFNSGIFYWIDKNRSDLTDSHTTVMCASKKVNDYLTKRAIPVNYNFPEVKTSNIHLVTQEIFNVFMNNSEFFTDIIIVSNSSKNFFSYETRITLLIPFIGCSGSPEQEQLEDYVWEHEPKMVLQLLAENILKTSIRTALFESLHAEQSARFISMDNATRNANNFLDTMKLHYNKARQAKITKELTELATCK